jgi:lipopolysaccharide export system protein LptA
MSAQSVHIIERDNFKVREVYGPARFLHNNTYLVCDTAIWYVDQSIINAYGHVQILQDETVLSSDKLDYYVDEDRAEFRGSVVQLQDKQNNTLRTRFLDFNTKDSVAVFQNGASMRDKDGQIIESTNGTYDSKTKIFEFVRNVNMYVDSVFVKTEYLTYYSNEERASFDAPIYAWQDDKMLSASFGEYDRGKEEFFFHGNVHALSENQEMWADSLYFYRALNNVELRHNAQVLDTTRNVMAVADYMLYVDSLDRVTMRDNAAVAAITEQDNQKDTLYMGADLIVYDGIRMCDISDVDKQASARRLENMNVDAVAEYRLRNAPTPAQDEAQEEKADESGDEEAETQKAGDEVAEPEVDEVEVAADSLSLTEESLDIVADTLAVAEPLEIAPEPEVQVDTTMIGLLTASGHARLFRNDIQALCDSMVFFQLDSIARLYSSPVVWNEEGRHQYLADSIAVLIGDDRLKQADLMSNAFVIIQESDVCFDQIRAAEMMAYFDTSATLRRFDALGGTSALFYLEENGDFATANRVECTMMSAYLADGQLDRVYYFDNPKNNAYPVVKLPKDERELRGFNWRAQERPKSRTDISTITFRDSERERYSSMDRPPYSQTARYFPGYMDSVYEEIARRDSLEAAAAAYRQFQADSLETARAFEAEMEELARLDSLATMPVDSLAAGIPGQAADENQEAEDDNLEAGDGNEVAVDTAEVIDESEAEGAAGEAAEDDGKEVLELDVKSLKDIEREARRIEQEKQRQERLDAREARWAELDARDAAKAERKAAKAAARERKRKLKMIRAQEKRAAKEQKILDRYIKRYEKQKARKQQRKGE